jgi:bifunctional non-homologous end joining protein LigD
MKAVLGELPATDERFPGLTGIPDTLAPHAAILDGELVAFDDHGRPSFGRLQPRIHIGSARVAAQRAAVDPVHYHVFDVLRLDGRDLTTLPYLDRRAALQGADEKWRRQSSEYGPVNARRASRESTR